jgi:hypothetical protein
VQSAIAGEIVTHVPRPAQGDRESAQEPHDEPCDARPRRTPFVLPGLWALLLVVSAPPVAKIPPPRPPELWASV